MPLFGDMMIGPFQYIELTRNYDASRWSSCTSGKESTQSSILKPLANIKSEYTSLMSELALLGSHKRTYEDVTKQRLLVCAPAEFKLNLKICIFSVWF